MLGLKARIRRWLGVEAVAEILADNQQQILSMHAAHAVELEKLLLAVADLRENLDMPAIVHVDEDILHARAPSGDPQMGA